MVRARGVLVAAVCVLAGAFAPAALGSPTFHPRVGHALGLIPPVNSQGNFNTEPSEGGVFTSVVYHGGKTMSGGVHVHLIFWQAPGYQFQGSPGSGIPSYEGLIRQYYDDVRTAETGTSGQSCTTASCNDFTVEPQYGWGLTPGGITSGDYSIAFNDTSTTYPSGYTSGDDVILDSDPYPTGGCTSPQDTKACITDGQLQAEVDNIVQSTTGKPRGLGNLWFVFLPPDVDECITTDVCGTNAFAGYHSLSNVNGHGLTIYALAIDPLIEVGSIAQGGDPEGNPDAEVTLDIANHETNEAMTDPEGVGWMDPDGYEVGDKCEFGPQHGTPLGFASDGSPYNQVVNGHKYLLQEMWSNADGGCVQASQKTIADSPLPLPQVNLTQFSPNITGNTETSPPSQFPVQVQVIRVDLNGNPIVLTGSGTVAAGSGAWNVRLPLGHAVGDDNDEIDVIYNNGQPGPGVPSPAHQVILTGNGGNPFTESGWTGWTDLDNGYALTNGPPPSLTIGPCFQTGTESYTINGNDGFESPTDFCSTSADTATAPLSQSIGPSDVVNISTNDNRAYQPQDAVYGTPNPNGGLVNLTITAGEPDSVSLFANPLSAATGVPFTPTGFPTCTGDLGAQLVTCTGLVPGENYTLTDGGQSAPGSADGSGTLTEPMALHRGDTVALSNGSRTLTTLHVANLQVHIDDASPGAVASGSCSADEWIGGPLTTAPVNAEAGGLGVALSGAACPSNGDATGMPTSSLSQTDELSGGQTVTEIADVANTAPLDGETVYGRFTALAQATSGTPRISVSIARASGGAPVFTAGNVDTTNGVPVSGLRPGSYTATWTVRDVNGDTRTLTTRFIEESGSGGSSGSGGPAVACTRTGASHDRIVCRVTLSGQDRKANGTIRALVARGARVVAMGHAPVKGGKAVLRLREIHRVGRGAWTITLVFRRAHHAAQTFTMKIQMR